ncbi:MAG TPA: hypothetical protein ENN89_05185, partial [Synergistetes bacterium]|nr:hypothetical protein [Synergistota bacterium]
AGVSVVRAVAGAFLVALYALFRDPAVLIPGFRDAWKYALVGLFGVVFVYYLSNIAFVTIPVGLTVILFYSNPIWTMVGAALMGKEHFNLMRLAALVAGFSGVWLAVGGSGGSAEGPLDPGGIAAAVISGVGYSVYMLNSRYGTGKDEPFKTFVQMFLWGAILMTGITLLRGEVPVFRGMPSPAVLSLGHLVIFPTILSYALISYALKHLPGTVASITSMSEILFAGLMAWALLGEIPSRGQIEGGALIVLAVMLLLAEGKIRGHPWHREGKGRP